MKVLLFNRNPKLWIGGDAIQVEETQKALQELGVQCVFAHTQDYPLNEADITHVFNINFDWTKKILTRLISEGRPYVISAIFFPEIYASTHEEMREFVNKSVKTIALSEAEKKEMVHYLKCDPDKIEVVPNGIDPSVFYMDNNQTDDFVVSIGRFQKMKGPHLLIEACKRAGKKLRYISSECKGEEAQEIRSFVDECYENVPKEQVADILRYSRVYVCPSLTERQSLGVLEAAACGLPIVDSIFNRGNTLLPSSIVVDPRNIDAMVEAINKQWNAPCNLDLVPTWEDVAKRLLSIYSSYVKPQTG